MTFKRSLSLFSLISYFLLVPSVFAGFQLGGENKVEEKKPRINISLDDFRYPMGFNNDIYDFLTVAIYGTAAPGTGVIIAQKEKSYYVLTANHVIGEVMKGDEIEVQTLDGEFHSAKLIDADKNIDGALIKFTSKNKYYPAYIDPEVKPKTGMYILTQGYALASKEAKKGSLRRSTGPVLTVIDDNKDGYDLFYDAATNVGMSGGGVYTDYQQTKKKGAGDYSHFPEGEHPCHLFKTPLLIGIHGRAESYRAGGKSGASMGLSIHTLLDRFGPNLVDEGIKSLPYEEETLIWKDGCPLYKEFVENR